MNRVVPKPLKTIFLWSLLLLLAACSTTAITPNTTTNDFHSVASVEVDKNTSVAELEAEYNATVVTFKPKAGFALLGFSKEQSELTTLATSSNIDAFETPELSAQALLGSGHSAWAGGHSAWAGGFSAWAGGWSAWAGGHSAWAGGTTIPAPTEANSNVWQQINLHDAHRYSRNFGAGVKVAVLDTGIDLTHPMFEGRLAPQSEWRDYIDNDNNPSEVTGNSYGHGTGVAGIILQIAPQATILPIRVLDGDGKGDTADVADAIIYAVDAGAQIINASLGTLESGGGLYSALTYATDQGAYVASSTGNYGPDVDMTKPGTYYAYHGTYGHVFGTGSLDANGNISNFTSYKENAFDAVRESVYVYAPGEQIFSAYPENRMAYYTGTSFASPLMAGAAALVYSEIPNRSNFNTSAYDLFPHFYPNLPGVENPWSAKLDVSTFLQRQAGWIQPEANTFGTVSATSGTSTTQTLSESGSWRSSAGRSSTSSANPVYSFDVTSSGSVSIDLSSSADTYLYLLNNSGSIVAENDDGGEGYNSRISITLNTGSYKLVAATYSAGQNASFQIKVTGGISNLKSATSTPTPNTQTLSKSGSWSSSGGRSYTHSGNPKYSFEVTEAGTVTIDLTSGTDTYLYLLNSSGAIIAQDDDGGSGTSSLISTSLSKGTYQIVAATYSRRKSDSFNINVNGFVNNLR